MKIFLKSFFRKIGLEVNRLNTDNSGSFQIAKIINHFNINTIYDVGANTGQYASELFELGFKGRIISFEPLSKPYLKLVLNSKKNNRWYVHDRCAIGSKNGQTLINISKNSVSSSILPILSTHVESAKYSSYIDSETVMVKSFDSIFSKYHNTNDKSLLKIDTQGFENEVLDGASISLSDITLIQCELSMVYLYENQKLYKEMIEKIEALGFTMWSIRSGFTNGNNGRTLQVDAILVNNNEIF
jgi:FkbM family methyltransferase